MMYSQDSLNNLSEAEQQSPKTLWCNPITLIKIIISTQFATELLAWHIQSQCIQRSGAASPNSREDIKKQCSRMQVSRCCLWFGFAQVCQLTTGRWRASSLFQLVSSCLHTSCFPPHPLSSYSTPLLCCKLNSQPEKFSPMVSFERRCAKNLKCFCKWVLCGAGSRIKIIRQTDCPPNLQLKRLLLVPTSFAEFLEEKVIHFRKETNRDITVKVIFYFFQ